MHSTFVIGCKFLAARPVVYECVRSIKKVYGDSAEIIVIDSDSEDKSYFSVLRDLGVVVDDAVNHHYTSGAIWCAFEKYIRDSYCFLHDSMTVGGKIDDYVKNDITSLRYFNSGKFFREYGGGLYPGEFGFDSVEQFEWVNEQFLLHTSYSIYSIPLPSSTPPAQQGGRGRASPYRPPPARPRQDPAGGGCFAAGGALQ